METPPAIKTIGVFNSADSEVYTKFILALAELNDDFNIKIIDTKKLSASLEHFDLVVLRLHDLGRVENSLVKGSSYGIFLDDDGESFHGENFNNNFVCWYNCLYDTVKTDRKIPVNYEASQLINDEQLIKNISFRIRDGIDVLEGKKNKFSNLLLPSPSIHTGRLSFANKNFKIKGKVKVSIGSYCAFGEDVLLITENHDTQFLATQGYLYNYHFDSKHAGELETIRTKEKSKGEIIIKNDVWIGDRVIVLSGVTIGNGACIAAGSIVTKDVEDFAIVAGIPARKLKMRFNDSKIAQIIEQQWWNWSNKKMKENKALFFEKLNTTENESR